MKIEIDDGTKTIKVFEDVKLDELFNFLNKVLSIPWKEYTLITTTTVINNYGSGSNTCVPYQLPYRPWDNPWYTGSPIYCVQSGTTTGYCSTTQTLN